MDIWVVNPLGNRILDTYESMIWNMRYYGMSDFELSVAGTPENLELLSIGSRLIRQNDILSNVYEYKNVMVIEKRELRFDAEKGWVLVVSGRGCEKMLSQRIIWNQFNWLTTDGSVAECIEEVIKENAIAPNEDGRGLRNLMIESIPETTDTFDVQVYGENLAEWLESVCKIYGYGWEIKSAFSEAYKFRLWKGTDRSYNQEDVPPVVFSPKLDNLISATYTEDFTTYRNAAKVGGEGEGTDQKTVEIGDFQFIDRYETFIDASSVSSNGEIIFQDEYESMLSNYGYEQLTDMKATKTFEGEIDPNGVFKLDEDFFLGDIVQVDTGLINATCRITEILYSEDESGVKIIPTFEEWEVE